MYIINSALILSIGYGLYIIIVLLYTSKQCNTLLKTTSVQVLRGL